MSSPWTERQGEVGNLGKKSKEELQELLLRQEKILSNRRLVQTLPDKGKKIKEFVERVQLAIELHDEEERRRTLVFSARTELQSKYQLAFSMRQRAVPNTPAGSHRNKQSEAAASDVTQGETTSPASDDVMQGATTSPASDDVMQGATTSPASVDVMQGETTSPPSDDVTLGETTSPASDDVQENKSLDKDQSQFVSRAAPGITMETAAAAAAAAGASLNSDETKEDDLVEALERVRMSETSTGFANESKDPLNSTTRDNYFLRKEIPKKPHYVTVLERTETTPAKQKFKTNQLPHRSDVSPSGSLSDRRGSLQLSAEARRERDRKHLDDITSARLAPLHFSPAQLLSLEESASLLQEQSKKQHELLAKMAAQKLSEGLRLSMGSYTPDGGPMASYREVHDEGAQLSSEED